MVTYKTSTGKLWQSLIGLLLSCALSWPLFAEPALVRYMDEEAGFIVLDQAPGAVKDGDRLCLFLPTGDELSCDARFRWHTRQPLVYLAPALFEKMETGQILEVKKILFEDRDSQAPVEMSEFQKKIMDDARSEEQKAVVGPALGKDKYPKGASPAVEAEVPSVEGDDFPEIFIPKLRKAKKKSQKDNSDLAIFKKGLKKTLKDKGLLSYQFATDPSPPAPTQLAVREDYPNPLRGDLRVSLISATPLKPMASYQTLRFYTIENASLERDTLWVRKPTQLEPSDGTGLNLRLSSRTNTFVNIGWRYHIYNGLKAIATYDEFDTELEANSSSRVSEQVINVDWGRIQNWTDSFYTSWAVGTDLAYSELNFESVVRRRETDEAFVLAYGRKSFVTIAPRLLLETGVQRWGYGFHLGAAIYIPALDFKNTFRGSVSVPERVNFSGSAEEDLKRSLAQQKNSFGYEILLGVSYQPQRN